MQLSTDRVLTTHTGSLPRPQELADMLIAKRQRAEVDEDAFVDLVERATTDVVRRQVETGIDVVSDGEMSKTGYNDYLRDRLEGFEDGEPATSIFTDLAEIPELHEQTFKNASLRYPVCVGDVSYVGAQAVADDVRRFKSALAETPATDAFMPAASPGLVAMRFPNKHYAAYEDYLFAVATALGEEYRAIVEGGLLIQIDSPDLAYPSNVKTWMWPEVERRGIRGIQDLHIEALNAALEGIPADSVRLHICWGNYQGPHTYDMSVREVLEPAVRANLTAINFESANPAHAHEAETFEDFELPDDKVLIPGVIDTKSQVVEHPRAVAQRVTRYVDLVGRERVIAGTDCGFGSHVGAKLVFPTIAWMKLRALVEGTALANERLAARTRGASA